VHLRPLNTLSRRSLLRRAVAIAVLAIPLSLRPDGVLAAKVSKDAVGYRDSPEGERMCSNCVHFVPGEPSGSCKVVAGDIDPEGWCTLWSAK